MALQQPEDLHATGSDRRTIGNRASYIVWAALSAHFREDGLEQDRVRVFPRPRHPRGD
jgi:hypothetical protein